MCWYLLRINCCCLISELVALALGKELIDEFLLLLFLLTNEWWPLLYLNIDPILLLLLLLPSYYWSSSSTFIITAFFTIALYSGYLLTISLYINSLYSSTLNLTLSSTYGIIIFLHTNYSRLSRIYSNNSCPKTYYTVILFYGLNSSILFINKIIYVLF